MPYFFVKNYKNQTLELKFFKLQQFQYFAIVFY